MWVPEPNSGCWLWTGVLTKFGYGHISGGPRGSKTLKATRVSWMLRHGEWPPDGILVCHRCDVRACVNPDHLFLGTHKENTQDMWRKGRRGGIKAPPARCQKGEHNPAAKVTDDIVRYIRKSGATLAVLAEGFGISTACVCLIKNRKAWSHVE